MQENLPIDRYAQGGNTPDELKDLKASKTLGIVSIVTSIVCCVIYGIPGLVTGIIGLVLANQTQKIYDLNPEKYGLETGQHIKNAKTLNIIGICISSLIILALVVFYIVMALVGNDFDPYNF